MSMGPEQPFGIVRSINNAILVRSLNKNNNNGMLLKFFLSLRSAILKK